MWSWKIVHRFPHLIRLNVDMHSCCCCVTSRGPLLEYDIKCYVITNRPNAHYHWSHLTWIHTWADARRHSSNECCFTTGSQASALSSAAMSSSRRQIDTTWSWCKKKNQGKVNETTSSMLCWLMKSRHQLSGAGLYLQVKYIFVSKTFFWFSLSSCLIILNFIVRQQVT